MTTTELRHSHHTFDANPGACPYRMVTDRMRRCGIKVDAKSRCRNPATLLFWIQPWALTPYPGLGPPELPEVPRRPALLYETMQPAARTWLRQDQRVSAIAMTPIPLSLRTS